MNHEKAIIRTGDLAKLLDCSSATIRNYVRKGDLPKPRRIGRGHPYWTRADLAAVVPVYAAELPKAA